MANNKKKNKFIIGLSSTVLGASILATAPTAQAAGQPDVDLNETNAIVETLVDELDVTITEPEVKTSSDTSNEMIEEENIDQEVNEEVTSVNDAQNDELVEADLSSNADSTEVSGEELTDIDVETLSNTATNSLENSLQSEKTNVEETDSLELNEQEAPEVATFSSLKEDTAPSETFASETTDKESASEATDSEVKAISTEEPAAIETNSNTVANDRSNTTEETLAGDQPGKDGPVQADIPSDPQTDEGSETPKVRTRRSLY